MTGALLVTGFGPFPGMPRNPAGALARRVGGAPRLRLIGARPRVLVLPTTYAALDTDLAPALAEAPAAILMLGVASRARRLRVEARAQNRGGTLHPDAAGCRSAGFALDPAGPSSRNSRHAVPALAILRRHGLAARSSIEAGRYLCNASYFLALARPCPVLFVHVPPVPRVRRPRRGGRPRVDPATQAAALIAVAALLVTRSRHRENR